MEAKALRIGILGAGTVGGSVARAIVERPERLAAFGGRRLELARVACRRPDLRAGQTGLPRSLFTDRIDEVVAQPEIDVVVAAMGGSTEEEAAIRAALEAGQHVVTANKAVLARVGPELDRLARRVDRALLYEAAVGGATPVLRAVTSSLGFLTAESVQAILNGTCNFILSRMGDGESFADALGDAQAKGLAEADPSLDIDGGDTAQKLTVLAGLAAGVWIEQKALTIRGIRDLTPEDIAAAKAFDAKLALVAEARVDGTGRWLAAVEPRLIPRTSPLANASRESAAALIHTAEAGPFFFSALGAGGGATGAAVLADLAAIARDAWRGEKRVGLGDAKPVGAVGSPTEKLPLRRYLRVESAERARVLAASSGGMLSVAGGKAPRSLATAGFMDAAEFWKRLSKLGVTPRDAFATSFLGE